MKGEVYVLQGVKRFIVIGQGLGRPFNAGADGTGDWDVWVSDFLGSNPPEGVYEVPPPAAAAIRGQIADACRGPGRLRESPPPGWGDL